jgi:hypothetical protein
MAQGIYTEPEPNRKLLLRHPQPPSNRPHIDLSRDVNDIGTLLRGPICNGKGLFKPADHALTNFAHDDYLRLRLISTSTRAIFWSVLISA